MNNHTSKINLLRTISFIAAFCCLGLLTWDCIEACNCHCSWSFAALLIAALSMFGAWLVDLYSTDITYK